MQAGERAARTMQRLSQLAEIGREGRAGAHRPGLSAAEQEACELVATWLRQEGLEVSWDACGNLYGRLAGGDPAARDLGWLAPRHRSQRRSLRRSAGRPGRARGNRAAA